MTLLVQPLEIRSVSRAPRGSTCAFSRQEQGGHQRGREAGWIRSVSPTATRSFPIPKIVGTMYVFRHGSLLEVPMSDPLRRIDALVEEDTLPTPQVRQQLRLAAGLTQTEVAEAIGVKRLAVAQWEAGRAQPHRRNRRAYAHLLRKLAAKHPDAAVEEASDEE